MPELTLHFEASGDTDLNAAAAALQTELAKTESVQSATARPQKYQSIGPAEVLSVIQVATTVAQSTAGLLTALAAVYTAWEKLRPMFPGLKAPSVEVGLKQIPVNQVTAEHAEELES